MATFKPRLTKPEAGNPYYNTRAKGGYSNAIQGKPTDPGCNVLANCVGYAYGRFNEIGGYGYCKYLSPVNAEKFIQYAGSLKVGQTPKLGACMVWRKGASLSGSDGAGHVAIVEKIISSTQVVTSESGYNSSKPFWTQTRNKGNGNWGAGSGYTFLGFIYNPAVSDDTAVSGSTSTSNTTKPSASNTTKPSTSTSTGKNTLTVNGSWDKATTKRLQQIFGTPADGIISNQHAVYRNTNPGLVSGWDWQSKPNGKGSMLIKAMQKWAGMPEDQRDGEWGPMTCKAVQKKLGTFQDGYVSNPSKMVKALQKWANSQ